MKSEELRFCELTEKEFASLKFDCGSFLQSVEMYQRHRKLGREVYLVGVKRAKGAKRGEIVAAGFIMVRKWYLGKKVMRVPGGWLMDYESDEHQEILEFLTREARKFGRKHGGVAIEITPNIVSQPRDSDNKVIEGSDHLAVKRELVEMGYRYLGEREQTKWVYVLDLEGKSERSVMANFRTTHRRLIRKAEREGVRVRELKLDELGILKQITAETGVKHGFREPEMEYYRSMKAAFGEKVKFVVAEIPVEKVSPEDLAKVADLMGQEGTAKGYVPLAASMFVDDGREWVYLYSGMARRLQKYNGAYAIQWWAIEKSLAEGRARYNFYGVKPKRGNGVYSFKQGFRGHVEELLGAFGLPIGVLGWLYLVRIKPQEFGKIE